MRPVLAVLLAVLSCVGVAGCTAQETDTSAANAWFADANESVVANWPDRIVSSGGGVVTRHDDGGHVFASLGGPRTVSELLVACDGSGDTADVSMRLTGAHDVGDQTSVSCTGEYETVFSYAGTVEGVTAIEMGFSTQGDPVGVSLVVLGP